MKKRKIPYIRIGIFVVYLIIASIYTLLFHLMIPVILALIFANRNDDDYKWNS